MNQLPGFVYVANRSVDKAIKICNYESCHAVSLVELKELEIQFDLIIHASSLGHQGKTLEFYPNNCHKKTLGYDLSYGKAATVFLNLCKENGLRNCFDGIGMLIEQAAYAFEIWFGVKPNTDAIKF
jgi:shikimate dehydrogenase